MSAAIAVGAVAALVGYTTVMGLLAFGDDEFESNKEDVANTTATVTTAATAAATAATEEYISRTTPTNVNAALETLSRLVNYWKERNRFEVGTLISEWLNTGVMPDALAPLISVERSVLERQLNRALAGPGPDRQDAVNKWNARLKNLLRLTPPLPAQ